MLIRYSGGSFNDLVYQNKNFIWLVYSDFQLDMRGWLALKPTWIKSYSDITQLIDAFPQVTFVESMYDEVIEELTEMGYQSSLPSHEGGLWDVNNEILIPLFIGMSKGWKKVDSIGKCYCTESLTDIMFEIYPEELQNYLNQPV